MGMNLGYLLTSPESGRLIGALERQNILLTRLITAETEATPVATLREIAEIVRAGEAPNVFSIGDQIHVNWNNGTADHVLPFDIVHFGDVELGDGEIVPGMFIQSHYALDAIQFDGNEAFFVNDTGAELPAGVYSFAMGNSWGTHVVKDKVYNFALENPIPVGGQLLLGTASSTTGALPDTAPANWRVYLYASASALTETEKVTLSEGTGGTFLGTLSSAQKYGAAGLNNMQRAAYGYNRWGQSGLRQYLNSAAAVEAWWTPQNPFDRAPNEVKTKRGFLAGFDEAFLQIIQPVKVRTALNTVSDTDLGNYEDTVDTFFPASLEQEYIVPQLANTEGVYWEYWKRRLGLSSPQTTGAAGTNAAHIRYAYDAKSSAQYCRVRSAYRGYAYATWYVSTSGTAASSYYAAHATRSAPACVIC